MKQKGFTLIELLAVIVILSIIALIATPIILGIIDNVKEESNKRSVDMYARAILNSIATYQLINKGSVEGKYTYNYGKISNGSVNLTVDYKGDVLCEIIQIYEDNDIYLENCKVNGSDKEYTYGIKKSTCTLAENGDIEPAGVSAGDKYLCKVKESMEEGYENGYTFYVLKTPPEGSITVDLIMDQNIYSDGTPAGTTIVSQSQNEEKYSLVAWQTSHVNADGPVTAMKFLYNATKNWTNVPELTYTYKDKEVQQGAYGYESFISEKGVASINGTTFTEKDPLRARMILYTSNSLTTEVLTKEAASYLYDNLDSFGYWTLSGKASSSIRTMYVSANGAISHVSCSTPNYGVRPVINVEI